MGISDDLVDLTPQERAQTLLARARKGLQDGAVGSENGIDRRHVQETERLVPTAPSSSFEADLVPDIQLPEKSPEQKQLDAVIDGIDILDAYQKFCGKMTPQPNGRTEGIMISCPMPGHRDSNPSAWINTNNQTWFCGGCQLGGDMFDLAAIHFGYDLNQYKDKSIFPTLRKQIAEAYGFTYIKDNISGQEFIVQEPRESEEGSASPSPAPEPESRGIEATPSLPQSPENNVTQLHVVKDDYDTDEEEDEDPRYLETINHPDYYIPWQSIAPEDTFLNDWMYSTTIDDLPHEYYFWLGLMGLGFACGMNNILMDYRPVKANLYICLYGRTGIGKSRAIEPFRDLLLEVFPFNEDPYVDPQGVKLLPTPNSAEAIIDSFHYEVKDASTQKFDHMASVSALMKHEELSGLIKKSERSGSSIKEVLIELYDAHGNDVSTHSRSSGVKKAHSPFAQMLSTTQPNAVHAFLRKTDVESGFLNRWIFAGGKGRIEPVAYGSFMHDITQPAHKLKNISAWTYGGHEFYLADEALEVWTDFFRDNLADYKSGRLDQESIFSRIDLVLKKVIVLLTVNEKKNNPTADIVERALKLYPYLILTYSMFTKDIAFNDLADCQQHLMDICKKLEKKNQYPSARDFRKMTSNKFDPELLTRAMKNLIDVGILETVAPQPGAKGRPAVRYTCIA